jgi:hypothetical protein
LLEGGVIRKAVIKQTKKQVNTCLATTVVKPNRMERIFMESTEHTKNNLSGLNTKLFEQLERLGNKDLKGESLREEIDRSKAVSGIARDIVANSKLVFDVQKTVWEKTIDQSDVPPMLTEK